jgi:hypothetical protein
VRVKTALRNAMSSLHESGTFPTKSKVAAELKWPFFFPAKWIREEYGKILLEFGIKAG